MKDIRSEYRIVNSNGTVRGYSRMSYRETMVLKDELEREYGEVLTIIGPFCS